MRVLLILVLFPILTFSQVTTKLYPYDPGTYDIFGYKLSIDSNFIAISSKNGSLGAGSCYIYKIIGIESYFIQKILPDTSYWGYNFGSPIHLADSLLLIGGNKKVFIYKLTNDSIFQKESTLVPFDPLQTEQFGRAISKHNNTLLIGAYLDGTLDKGAAYYYEYDDTAWVFKQKIYPSLAERHAHFGSRLMHNSKFAVISAPGDGFESGPFRGSVFVYEKTDSGWVEIQKILPTDSAYYQLFGVDLALDGTTIAIGAVGGLNEVFNGRIYTYEIDKFGAVNLQDSIFASDNFPGNCFGFSFRLRGDSLFVGAGGQAYTLLKERNLQDLNWAYLIVKSANGWQEVIKFGPTIQNPINVFGYSVDFVNGNFIVSAPDDSTNGFKSGVVYLFQPNLTSIDNYGITNYNFILSQNYPNPFNPSTKISWQSPVGSWQTLKVYDILGNEVAILVNEYRDAGNYEIDFQSTVGSHQLANGVYFYQLRVGDPSTGSGQSFVETKKMILLK